ncbi:hypothetical protein Pedsa_2599 [Pseudopedobacter saltans DSM 12145]|uniref:MerR family transcriptional regulator n=1 Tax=Pseudopedobacter saltans (strain ATCC 51119 / DSM 12145 / JCM 21818 / CCUG 39354 / LMG 10337 / NBRC 100064 / NCIMB 13643) TaxID=762903 RepID=F0S5H7_PSESL|nr:chaperone modulator CbpM [Pseudopedobacter saltans]ADY53141.1 hypothetical protein Pedsa_2599 [Pseudopedobacter saltans DSM 12145]
MGEEKRISVEQCCAYYSIEISFMQQLDEHGLINLSHSKEKTFIDYEQLADLERYIRLHYDLEINMEGLETIKHLLQRIQNLQNEVKRLHNESHTGNS